MITNIYYLLVKPQITLLIFYEAGACGLNEWLNEDQYRIDTVGLTYGILDIFLR